MVERTNRVRRDSSRGRAAVVFLALACLAAGAVGGVLLTRSTRDGALSKEAPKDGSPTLWTCSMHPQVIQDHPGLCPICHMELTPLGAAPSDSGVLAIDPAVVQSMGVRTVRVASGPQSGRRVRAFGTLVEREPDHRDVSLRVKGWIETLYANTDGMMVAKGDPLFTLSSPELVVAVQELIEARKQRDGRSGDHHGPEPSGSGASDLGAQLFAAARSKLVLMGLDAEQVDRLARLDEAPATVTFTSPMDGHVIESTVYAGAAVEPGTRVMRIADNTILWLEARVPTQDFGRISIAGDVKVRVDAYPDREFAGQVVFVHPHVDMETRTLLVRAEIQNRESLLHEGMWAVAEIRSADSGESLGVPREAVIDTGERQVVFVALGGGRFEPRDVVLGADRDGGMVRVVSGLSAGEEVVVSGQFLLDSESRMREAVRKFLSAGAAAAPEVAAVRPAWSADVDALVARYLELAEALGKPQETDAPVDARAFAAAARDLAAKAPGDARIAAVASTAAALVDADLSLQRERFKAASASLIDLVSAVPPSAALGPAVFVMWCPMAPGHWLQRREAVENPFYARTMKSCGEIQRRLPTVPAAAPTEEESPR